MNIIATLPDRQSIRLRGYDYSLPGAYFVTICATGKQCLFGVAIAGVVRLNRIGDRVTEIWQNLPHRFPSIDLDTFVLMPNHLHAVICLTSDPPDNLTGQAGKGPALAEIVRVFKSVSTHSVNQLREQSGPIWQRNYFERVIRGGDELNQVRVYINENPNRWSTDPERHSHR